MSVRDVTIHYRRLPDRIQTFRQPVLAETDEYVVTFAPAVPLDEPVRAGERIILEPESPVVWFTYPGEWHDIGRFHLADGTFTGLYANLLTPVQMAESRWDTTDLCLDIWVGADGQVQMLDEDEFADAVRRGWIDPATAGTVRDHAAALVARAQQGLWPPPHVAEWDLPRARRRWRELQTQDDRA